MTTKELDSLYVAPTYKRFPVEIVSGKGSLVRDEKGREYIDMGSGIAANIFGVADDKWIAAVTEQLGKFQHTSNLYYSEPCARLAQLLCEKTGMKKVFFANSGAEANECAVKAARKWGQEHRGDEYYHVITLKNSFHGRTISMLAANGQDAFHDKFKPLTEGFLYADPADPASLEKIVSEHPCAAIMFEAVQGEGGVLPITEEFAREMVRVAEKYDLLLIADEVQIGNGRSGMMYGYMTLGLQPDIVTTAKGLGGGLPIGACMLGERVQDVFAPGDHGSTFGGNPAACAGAVNIMERLDEETLEGVRRRSKKIFETLTGADGIVGVSGLGLMIGFEPVRPVSEITDYCIEHGVLVLTAKNKIRLLPALNIPEELLDKALSVILEACAADH